jgi:hypothetical protein
MTRWGWLVTFPCLSSPAQAGDPVFGEAGWIAVVPTGQIMGYCIARTVPGNNKRLCGRTLGESGHGLLQVFVDLVEEALGGQPLLLRAD